jgi:hypothetical protein
MQCKETYDVLNNKDFMCHCCCSGLRCHVDFVRILLLHNFVIIVRTS